MNTRRSLLAAALCLGMWPQAGFAQSPFPPGESPRMPRPPVGRPQPPVQLTVVAALRGVPADQHPMGPLSDGPAERHSAAQRQPRTKEPKIAEEPQRGSTT